MIKPTSLWGLFLWASTVTSLGHSIIKRQDATDPRGDICRFWDHRSVMIDDEWVYVDFGLATFSSTVKEGWAYRMNPFGLNLSLPFEIANLGSESDSYIAVNITEEIPPTTKGALWADKDNTIYKYGGYFPLKAYWGPNDTTLDVRPSEIWALETKNNTWSKVAQPGGATVSGARNGGNAYVPELGKGFFAGGHLSNQTDSKFANWTGGEAEVLSSIATYDMESNTWENTTTPYNPFTLSSLVYVPVGKQGILVSLGGISIPAGMFNWTSSDLTPRDMDSISIYDIERESWFTQRATGSIPRDRYSFCAVAAVSEDKSSYNIIIHGGNNFNELEVFSDTYVLSMPSFQFVQVDAGTKDSGRADHTCHLSKNKMIVIGGRAADQDNPGFTKWSNGACDPNGLINILDINTFKWDSSYDPSAGEGYKVQEAIYDVIGGDERGCATELAPEAGWGAARLRELFSNYTAASDCSARQPTRTTRTSSATGSSAASSTDGSISSMNHAKDSMLYLGLSFLAIIMPFL